MWSWITVPLYKNMNADLNIEYIQCSTRMMKMEELHYQQSIDRDIMQLLLI